MLDLLLANGVLGSAGPFFAASRLCLEREDRRSSLLDPRTPEIALERLERGGLGSRRGGFPTSHISVI